MRAPTAKTLLAKVLLFLVASLTLTELFWRSAGYSPARSDLMLFAKLRRSLPGDPNAVALVGSSRVRCDLAPSVLAQTVPGRRFVQLAILGNGGLPILEDLARDPSFRGRVICEFHASYWSGQYPLTDVPEQLSYVYPKVRGAYLETVLGEEAKERFSFISFNLFTEVPRIIQKKPIPQPEPEDRFAPLQDFGPFINQAQLHRWEQTLQETAKAIREAPPSNVPPLVPRWVDQIRARGGDVVFVHMPVDGELRRMEEELLPQTVPLMNQMRAQGLAVIDYTEVMTEFYCPDGSHLIDTDALRFSRALGQILAARGFFQ